MVQFYRALRYCIAEDVTFVSATKRTIDLKGEICFVIWNINFFKLLSNVNFDAYPNNLKTNSLSTTHTFHLKVLCLLVLLNLLEHNLLS
jgi:hypothetical protein